MEDDWRSTQVRVRLSETDAMRVVYHSVYFTYVEDALQQVFQPVHEEVSCRFPLGFPNLIAHASCDYRSPAHLNDLLEVSVRVGRLGQKSLTIEFKIANLSTNKLAAEGKRIHVAIDPKTFKTTDLPEKVKNMSQKFQAHTG